MGKSKFDLEVVFDYEGYPDYYRGHGHAFVDENVVACIPFGFCITYLETVQDIIDMVLEDINGRMNPVEFLNEAEDDEELQEEIEEFLTDENIARAIMETLPDGVKPSDRFFDVSPEEEEEIKKELEEDDSPFCEGPMLIGYIHVWKTDEPVNQ
jgi:predicted house-cleaning noncanonical NTP pyrophosphatase (MazG superfamily)